MYLTKDYKNAVCNVIVSSHVLICKLLEKKTHETDRHRVIALKRWFCSDLNGALNINSIKQNIMLVQRQKDKRH